ncbi:MAG TPA: LCP family protein [Nocardioides sp.]|nr:LCP family protein [Nocardioides sp.]
MAGPGDDDYDWIYGKERPSSSDPEPTRRIPVQRQPDRLPPPQQYDAPTQPPRGRPAPSSAPPRRSRWKRPRTWIRLVLALLVVWLVYTVAVPFVVWGKVDKVDFTPSGDRPSDQPGTTYLLVGSDSRKGLTRAERRKLHTGNAKSNLTDTIMLLHTGDGPNTLISIPRDSPLDIPGHGVSKVNSAFAKGGMPLLTKTLEKATGLRIDEFVQIGFGGLVNVVDAVGGIEICPKQRIDDKLSGLHVKKGCQEADGVTALAYSRARHYSPLSDLARVQQQREVVAAVGHKVLSPWSVVNPVRWWQLNSAVPDFFKFGEGTGPVKAGEWALAMTSVKKSCTVPLAGGDASWDKPRARQLFAKVAADKTDDITKRLCTASGIAN